MRLNNHRKKIEKKYIIIIIIIIISLMIGLFSLIIRDDRHLSFIESGIKDVGVSIQKVLYTPIRFVIDQFGHYNDMKRIYNKYKDIDENELKSTLLEKENEELKRSIAELKSTLHLNTIITEYSVVNATVVNRDVGDWYNTLTIDKGKKQGLRENMIVINNSGLIGKIIQTTNYTSEVKLLTTPDLNSKISVGIVNGDKITYGLLSGYDIKNKTLLIIDIVDDTPINVGDSVITSGLSNLFPKGIVIGTVSKIGTDEFNISKTVELTPSVDFNDIRYVTVLKGLE